MLNHENENEKALQLIVFDQYIIIYTNVYSMARLPILVHGMVVNHACTHHCKQAVNNNLVDIISHDI